MADIDPAFVQKVFHISQGSWKPDVHQYAKLDDLGRGFEVAERVFRHGMRLLTEIDHLKVV
ncbi:hypothetical protein [Hyphomonas sp.]|uniref:hypothetical protein n=1 Tax=Hyphomonas sp. TaxID=87 RepID=UPI003567A3BE